MLLAELVDTSKFNLYFKTKDAEKGKNFPERVPRPGVKPQKQKIKNQTMSLQEAIELGKQYEDPALAVG